MQGERPAPRRGGMLVRGRELSDVPDVLPGPSALTFKNTASAFLGMRWRPPKLRSTSDLANPVNPISPQDRGDCGFQVLPAARPQRGLLAREVTCLFPVVGSA